MTAKEVWQAGGWETFQRLYHGRTRGLSGWIQGGPVRIGTGKRERPGRGLLSSLDVFFCVSYVTGF